MTVKLWNNKSQFTNKLVVPSTKKLQPVEQQTVLKENVETTKSVRLQHKTQTEYEVIKYLV